MKFLTKTDIINLIFISVLKGTGFACPCFSSNGKGIITMNYEAITSILNDGLVLATGCTEPGALALTAATAAAHLGEEVKSIHTFASGNIIKNAYSAGIPGTDFVGICLLYTSPSPRD